MNGRINIILRLQYVKCNYFTPLVSILRTKSRRFTIEIKYLWQYLDKVLFYFQVYKKIMEFFWLLLLLFLTVQLNSVGNWPQPSQWTDWLLCLSLQNYKTSSARLLRWGFHYNINSQLQTGQLETILQSIKEAFDMHWNELHLEKETINNKPLIIFTKIGYNGSLLMWPPLGHKIRVIITSWLQ